MGKGRAKAKKHQPTRRPVAAQRVAAAGSVAVAAAAQRSREQAAKRAAAERETGVPGGLALLERAYASLLAEPAVVVVAHCGDAAAAKLLRDGAKALRAPAVALHAAASRAAVAEAARVAGGGLLAVADDFLQRLPAALARAGVKSCRVAGDDARAELEKRRAAAVAGARALPWRAALFAPLDTIKARCRAARGAAAAPGDERARTAAIVALHADGASASTRRKMAALGMLGGATTRIANDRGERRELARTRFLDGSVVDGAPWRGAERDGAAADAVSLRVRDALVEDWETLAPGWRPNPKPGDGWGGAFGKCCGHNEVVMHAVRPFAPLEVLNTKCCSRADPAPGNDGFDGCLEFLAARARAKRRPATVWDSAAFHCVGADGVDDVLEKRDLLVWPLDRVAFVVPALRRLTVATDGAVPARALLARVDALLALGEDAAATLASPAVALPRRATALVVAFALGGGARPRADGSGRGVFPRR